MYMKLEPHLLRHTLLAKKVEPNLAQKAHVYRHALMINAQQNHFLPARNIYQVRCDYLKGSPPSTQLAIEDREVQAAVG